MTYLAAEPATEHPEPPDGHPAGPVPAPLRDVQLSRLIGLARLSPPQALEIAAGVLTGAAQQSAPDPLSNGHGNGHLNGHVNGNGHVLVDRLRIARVAVDADGRVVLTPAADGAAPSGVPVGAVLAEVAGAARLGARRPDPAAAALLGRLDRAVTDLPSAGLPTVAATLEEAAAAIDRATVRAELGALVRAVGDGPGSTSGGTTGGGAGRARTGAAAGPRPPRGRRSTALRRTGAWSVSVVVLVAVVLLEVGLLRDRIAADIGLLLDAGRSGSAPSAAPEADGRPVVPPAPAAAGSVTGVDLRPLAPCAPGAPCTLRLLVQLAPGTGPRDVTWSWLLVDRCTGATTTAPGGTVTVPDGGRRAAAVGTVVLPSAPAVAVLAVTDQPAAAASAPVAVGSCQTPPTG